MIELTQPGSGAVLRVSEEQADYWRALGYRDKPKPRAATRRKAAAKDADSKDEG